MKNCFFGKYFKCENENSSIAFIPALHRSGGRESASLQIISDGGSLSLSFDRLQRYSDGTLSLGGCRFSDSGITLCGTVPASRAGADGAELTLGGEVRFTNRERLHGDIMGPFKFVPFMQCRHSVYSLRHRVDGQLYLNNAAYSFSGGRGYTEGDRGCSFPDKYLWTHCSTKNVSLMLSAATVPVAGFSFTGVIAAVLFEGRQYRLATYMGAKAEIDRDGAVFVRQGGLSLYARLMEKHSAPLLAPESGCMSRIIKESIVCKAYYRFEDRGNTVFEFTSERASFEFEY